MVKTDCHGGGYCFLQWCIQRLNRMYGKSSSPGSRQDCCSGTYRCMPPCRVPLTLKDRLKDELTRLKKESVIIKEEEPTHWVSSLVVSEKPNRKLRVCINPQHLNEALKRSHYLFPESLWTYFQSVLWDGFLQILLGEESSKYRYFWMPFEICLSPEYFQRKLDQSLEESWCQFAEVVRQAQGEKFEG